MTTATTATTTATIESCVDELVNGLVNEQMKTLKERIGNNTIELNNYLKYPGGKGRKTGDALLLNKISYLSVIDIDINKNYNDEQKAKVYNDVINSLSDDDVIVKTASGGIHIYCNTDLFPASSNRMVKCFTSDDYDVDIFSTVDKNKQYTHWAFRGTLCPSQPDKLKDKWRVKPSAGVFIKKFIVCHVFWLKYCKKQWVYIV
jgi:hypothetical protein